MIRKIFVYLILIVVAVVAPVNAAQVKKNEELSEMNIKSDKIMYDLKEELDKVNPDKGRIENLRNQLINLKQKSDLYIQKNDNTKNISVLDTKNELTFSEENINKENINKDNYLSNIQNSENDKSHFTETMYFYTNEGINFDKKLKEAMYELDSIESLEGTIIYLKGDDRETEIKFGVNNY